MRRTVPQSSRAAAGSIAENPRRGHRSRRIELGREMTRVKWRPSLAAIALLAAPAPLLPQDGSDIETATACPAESETFILPTTGAAFTLPPDPEQANCAEPAAPPPPVRPPAPSLFRMVALPVGDTAPRQKWELARLGEVSEERGPWDELLSEAGRMASGDPIAMVNQWVNWHVRFRDDAYGDEWSSAPETLRRGFGDCEDFALAKRGLLLALGVSPDDMYLVLLRDQRQAEHAVLVVNRGGRLLVLDNRTDKVLPAEAISDYTPILSFSGPFAWTYGQRLG
jgi:predicted transglutaminase-like cysteine proteinase